MLTYNAQYIATWVVGLLTAIISIIYLVIQLFFPNKRGVGLYRLLEPVVLLLLVILLIVFTPSFSLTVFESGYFLLVLIVIIMFVVRMIEKFR